MKLRKFFVLVLGLSLAFSVVGCGGNQSVSNGDADAEEAAVEVSTEEVDYDALSGNYFDTNTGYTLKLDSDSIDLQTSFSGYASFIGGMSGFYTIDNNKITTGTDTIGDLSLINTNEGFHFENDKHSFIPESEYFSFEFTTPYQLGDEVETEVASIKLKDYSIDKNILVNHNISQEPGNPVGNGYEYEAADGKCYVSIDYNLSNMGTDSIKAEETVSVMLVYDNKYMFRSNETKGNMITLEPDGNVYVLDGWGYYGGTEEISALMSADGTFHIMCPEVVMEDNSKSLYAIIQIGKENGNGEAFVYQLR